MLTTPITRKEFELFQRFFLHQHIGLSLPESKQMMLAQRLGKRLRINQCASYGAYFELIRQDRNAQELQILIDLITTHETYFFSRAQAF